MNKTTVKQQKIKKMSPIKYYSSKEIADFLGVTKRTIERKMKTGELKGVKRLGKWFIAKDDFDNYMEYKEK